MHLSNVKGNIRSNGIPFEDFTFYGAPIYHAALDHHNLQGCTTAFFGSKWLAEDSLPGGLPGRLLRPSFVSMGDNTNPALPSQAFLFIGKKGRTVRSFVMLSAMSDCSLSLSHSLSLSCFCASGLVIAYLSFVVRGVLHSADGKPDV